MPPGVGLVKVVAVPPVVSYLVSLPLRFRRVSIKILAHVGASLLTGYFTETQSLKQSQSC